MNRKNNEDYYSPGFKRSPIVNEADFIATQNRINSILDKPHLTQDDRDYLKILGMLIYEYEENYENF